MFFELSLARKLLNETPRWMELVIIISIVAELDDFIRNLCIKFQMTNLYEITESLRSLVNVIF